MPDIHGRKLVSETHFHGIQETRLVISLELKVDKDVLEEMPSYKRKAIAWLRDTIEEVKTPQGVLAVIEEADGVYVVDTTIQAAG